MKLRSLILLFIFIVSSNAAIALTNQVSTKTSDTNLLSKSQQSMPTLNFSANSQSTNALANMIADFNANFSAQYGFKVQLTSAAYVNSSQHDTYVADFQNHSSIPDIISMDIIWLAEFASHGYILPLDNATYMNTTAQSQFFQADINSGTVSVNGTAHLYSVPWFHDSALLYYRSDILQYAYANGIIPANRPPQTWPELTNWTVWMLSNTTLVNKFHLSSGFVWQGKAYEGLICDFMEYLGGTGTYSFLNSNQTAPIFNSSIDIKVAMQYMKDLINEGASPSNVLNYDEEASRAVWNAGNAIFMRNWLYAYALSLNSPYLNGTQAGTNVQQFNVTTMPAQGAYVQNPKTSCLGGWQLGISAYSHYPEQAKAFVQWLTAPKQQLTYFLGNGVVPTRPSVYSDPTLINSSQGYVKNFLPMFQESIPRPVTTLYNQMSAKIQPTLNSYLAGNISIDNALNKMQTDVQGIIPPPPVTATPTTTSTPTTTTPITTTTITSKATITSLISGFELFSVIGLMLLSSIMIKKRNLRKK